jgi:hypothetical protein
MNSSNSSIIASNAYQLEATTVCTAFPPISENSTLLGPANKVSPSWRKFIPSPTQQLDFTSIIAVVPSASITTGGPTVLRPAPLTEDYDVRRESFFRFIEELESGAYTA